MDDGPDLLLHLRLLRLSLCSGCRRRRRHAPRRIALLTWATRVPARPLKVNAQKESDNLQSGGSPLYTTPLRTYELPVNQDREAPSIQ